LFVGAFSLERKGERALAYGEREREKEKRRERERERE